VLTGHAETAVELNNTAGANVARIGGGTGAAGGTTTARILGNGTGSDNAISLASINDVILNQTNNTDVANDVDVNASTGYNHASDNTGGGVDITTGHAITDVMVDNMVGFNAASLDNCGCLEDLDAKISGNGSDSDNALSWAGVNLLTGFQTNNTALDNDLSHLKSDTGYNKANDNTGAVSFANDPSVLTGGAGSFVEVNNNGGVNTFGEGFSEAMHNVDFNFDFAGIMSFFHHAF
jgi:hypothetical protein